MIDPLAYAVMILSGILLLWGLALALADRPPGRAPLLATAGLEVIVVAQSVIAGIALIGGFRPAELATTIGYLIGILVLLPLAFFWANNERTRFSGVVLAIAGTAVAVMTLRLLDLWTPA